MGSEVLASVLMVSLSVGLTSGIGVVTYAMHTPDDTACDMRGESGGFVRVVTCEGTIPDCASGSVRQAWRETVFYGVASRVRVWECMDDVAPTETTDHVEGDGYVPEPTCSPGRVAIKHYGRVLCAFRQVDDPIGVV